MQFLDLGWFEHGLRVVMAWLCSIIYPLISMIYQLFTYLTRVEFLTSDMVKPIYQRVTVIISIIMVFYVTFEFIKYIVQPDGITDKEKGVGKIIYKLIAVVVLIAFVPNIFSFAYTAQNVIVDRDIIGLLIHGKSSINNEQNGRIFAERLLVNFYKKTGGGVRCERGLLCDDIVDMNILALNHEGELPYITYGLGNTYTVSSTTLQGDTVATETPAIYFNGLMAVATGAFMIYILILYCIDIGVRWGQMVFLQVIAPIPIIGFLSPSKDGMFQKWAKQCLTTYLDLFIRIVIINYVIFVSGLLLKPESLDIIFGNLTGISDITKGFIIIVLVMGLLLFAQKAPKLLGELFPKMGAASGNFGLSGKERFEPTVKAVKGIHGFAKRTSGAVTGAAVGIGSAIKNSKSIGANNGNVFTKGLSTAYSATKAAVAGAKAGASKGGGIRQANAAARQSVQGDVSVADKGGTVLGHDVLGGYYQGRSVNQDREMEAIKSTGKAKDRLFSQVDELSHVKSLKKSWDAAKAAGDDALAKTIEGQYKAAGQAARRAIVAKQGAITETDEFTYVYKDQHGNYQSVTMNFDEGDKVFANAINHISEDENKKSKISPISEEYIDVIKTDIDGKPIVDPTTGKPVKERKQIKDLTDEEYAASLHSIADIAKAKEQEKYTDDYYKAHANANSAAPGGKR